MTDTKKRLCDAARKLFREKGYDRVSLREIAEKAGTTIGNLTYHFPHKDHLLAALQEQLQTDFPMNREFDREPEYLLRSLLNTFFDAEKKISENLFYYQNMLNFYRDSKKARNNIEEFRRKLFDYYYSLFTVLRDKKAMSENYSEESYAHLASLLVSMEALWATACSFYSDETLPNAQAATALFLTAKPYISDKYQGIYEDIYREFREKQTQ